MRMTPQELSWLAEDFYNHLKKERRLGSWAKADLNDSYQEYRVLKKCLHQKAINFGTVLYFLTKKRIKYGKCRDGVITFFDNIQVVPGANHFKNTKIGAKRKQMLPEKIVLGEVIKKQIHADSKTTEERSIKFGITNESTSDLRIKDVFFLRNKFDFGIEDERFVRLTNLRQQESLDVRVICKINGKIGITSTEICLLFNQGGYEYLGSQKLEFNVIDEIVDLLKPRNPYIQKRIAEEPRGRSIVDSGKHPKDENVSQLENILGLDKHEIPSRVKECFRGRKLRIDPTFKSILQKKIDRQNYAEKFHLLLEVEELQNRADIRRYTMENVSITKVRGTNNLMEIKVPGLAEKRPSVLRGDRVHVTKAGNNYDIYRGFVHKTYLNTISVSFGPTMNRRHVNGGHYNVEFTLNTLPFTIMHRSLEIVRRETYLTQLLCPTSENVYTASKYSSKLTLFNRILESNPEQLQTINNIVNHKLIGAPYLIFGPPGTGKTVTVVESIKQVHKLEPQSHILVCAPSNSACDLLVDRLMVNGRIEKREIFRMSAVSRHFDSIESDVVKSVSNFDHDNGVFYFPSKSVLTRYRIIVSTLVTAGRLASAQFPIDHFTDVFVDEAGYAMEPECVVALAGIIGPKCRVVLAGDCMQLGPIIHNKLAAKRGLGTSLLERLTLNCGFYSKGSTLRAGGRTMTKLLNNYRSHETILKVPNELFYENELKVRADVIVRSKFCRWEKLPRRDFPIVFNGVQGKDDREDNSPSYFNAYEVSAVVSHVKELLNGNITIRPRDIGIITPYYKQVTKIRDQIKKLKRYFNAKVEDIKVGTVEEFQGQERLVIIISTVRSSEEYLTFDRNHHLGFVQNPKRFNVAVTRAKSLLIIVGNPRLLSMDPSWRTLLAHCINNGGYKGVDYRLDDSDDEYEICDSDDENVVHEIEETPDWLTEK